jgi:hypothetical protein
MYTMWGRGAACCATAEVAVASDWSQSRGGSQERAAAQQEIAPVHSTSVLRHAWGSFTRLITHSISPLADASRLTRGGFSGLSEIRFYVSSCYAIQADPIRRDPRQSDLIAARPCAGRVSSARSRPCSTTRLKGFSHRPQCPKWVDAVEKVFSGRRMTFFIASEASRVRRCEGPHQITQKQPRTLVLPYRGSRTVEIVRNCISRDFRRGSIFDFFDSIGH